jgi:hypothetical protein
MRYRMERCLCREPADQNLVCYSYRIHELLLRACIEVEANCKAILLGNGYKRRLDKHGNPIDLNMFDYIKIEQSHKLSKFEVAVPTWAGIHGVRTPFSSWAHGQSTDWYQAYNQANTTGTVHLKRLPSRACSMLSADAW